MYEIYNGCRRNGIYFVREKWNFPHFSVTKLYSQQH